MTANNDKTMFFDFGQERQEDIKETLKPFQSYPRTSKKASNWIVITESNLYTIHWNIFKNNCQNDAWKQQHIKLPMLCDLLPQIFLRNRHCSLFCLLHALPFFLLLWLLLETFHVCIFIIVMFFHIANYFPCIFLIYMQYIQFYYLAFIHM